MHGGRIFPGASWKKAANRRLPHGPLRIPRGFRRWYGARTRSSSGFGFTRWMVSRRRRIAGLRRRTTLVRSTPRGRVGVPSLMRASILWRRISTRSLRPFSGRDRQIKTRIEPRRARGHRGASFGFPRDRRDPCGSVVARRRDGTFGTWSSCFEQRLSDAERSGFLVRTGFDVIGDSGDPATTQLVPGGFEPAMRQIMSNLQTVLKAVDAIGRCGKGTGARRTD